MVPGSTIDLSSSGIRFRCRHRLRPRSNYQAKISPDGRRLFPSELEVLWLYRVQEKGALQDEEGITPEYIYGCRFTKKDRAFQELLEEVILGFHTKRHAIRMACALTVLLEGSPVSLKRQADNISSGGIFVNVDDPPPPNMHDEIDLRILLPDALDAVFVHAKVVHVVTPDMAQLLGGSPGVGVQFLDFGDQSKNRLNKYLTKQLDRTARGMVSR